MDTGPRFRTKTAIHGAVPEPMASAVMVGNSAFSYFMLGRPKSGRAPLLTAKDYRTDEPYQACAVAL